MTNKATAHTGSDYIKFIIIGLAAGLLSGLFGVGGGTVIVPLLVTLLSFNQRLAAGTSLAAIVPTASVGVISYAVSGSVAWIPALMLAVGAVIGAQIGTYLLPRISQTTLKWCFVVFLAIVIVNLFFVIPSRDAAFQISWQNSIGLTVLGLCVGTVSGLIGVGGGIIVVPFLILVFGTSDLVAKGTSLLMMIPAALSGTVGNLKRKNVDLVAAATIGVSACATTALGAKLAALIDPFVANILFAIYLVIMAIQIAPKRAKK